MIIEKPQQTDKKGKTWSYTIKRLPECKHEDGIHTPACLLQITQLIFPEMLQDVAKMVSEYEGKKKVAERKESTPVENKGGGFFASIVKFIRDEFSWYGSDESEVSKNEINSNDFDQTPMGITNHANFEEKWKTSNFVTEETKDRNDASGPLETSNESTPSKKEIVTNTAFRETQSEYRINSKVNTCDISHGPIGSAIVMVESSCEEAQSSPETENDGIKSVYANSRKPELNYAFVLAENSKNGNGSHEGLKRTRKCYRIQSVNPYGNLVTCVESHKRKNDNKVHFNDDIENIPNNSIVYNFDHQLSYTNDYTQTESEVEGNTESSVAKDEVSVGANYFGGNDGEHPTLINKVESTRNGTHDSENTSVEVNNTSESETYYSLESDTPKCKKKKHSTKKSRYMLADENLYQNIIKRIQQLEQECHELRKKNEVVTQETKPETVPQQVQKQEPEGDSTYLDLESNKIKNQNSASAIRNSTMKNSLRFTERFIPYENDKAPTIITPQTKRQKIKSKMSAALKKMAVPFKKLKIKKNLKSIHKLKIKRKK
ncbi:hypothetical protein ACTXT7_001073 [Hymenolepis weldensis]